MRYAKGYCATCSGGVLAVPQVMRSGFRHESHPQQPELLRWFCGVCNSPFGGLLAFCDETEAAKLNSDFDLWAEVDAANAREDRHHPEAKSNREQTERERLERLNVGEFDQLG